MVNGDFATWADMVDSWQDAAMAWGDTIIPWEDGPLAIRRGTYGRYLIAWAGGGTGRSTLIREATYTDGTVERAAIPGSHDVPLAAADVWVDGDAPYGEDVEQIVFKLGSSSVRVPPEDRRWEVLSDPFNGLAANVIGAEITDLTWESATSITYRHVTAWDAPLVHARPEQKPVQQLALFTTTRRDRELVAEMCAQRRPLLLRSPIPGVDDMWFVLAGARTESRLNAGNARDHWRRHTWALHLLDRPDPRTAGRHAGGKLSDIIEALPTSTHPQWVNSGQRHMLSDTDRYEAFPRVDRLGDGIVASWMSQTDHYQRGGASYGFLSTSSDGRTWAPPARLTTSTHAPVAVRTLGGRIGVLAMTHKPYAGYIMTGTSITGMSTPRKITNAEWGTDSWTFPGDLLWVDDGTSNGLMLAACYSGDGIHVTASTDAGATWAARSHPIKALFASSVGPAEPQMVRLKDGRILMLVRWDKRLDPGTDRLTGDIHAMWSSDLGRTWTAPVVVIPDMTGQPCVNLMPDGSLIATLRDPALDDSPQSWSLAESRTEGETWVVCDYSDEFMMYGNAIGMPDGSGLLVGASHMGTTNSDVWVQALELGSVERATLGDIHAKWATLGDIATDAIIPEAGIAL